MCTFKNQITKLYPIKADQTKDQVPAPKIKCSFTQSVQPPFQALYFFTTLTKCTMTHTCWEASQCAAPRTHEHFSGRQLHASFGDYIHICLSQQQQTHTGKKIQWNNLQKQILKDHPACNGFSSVLLHHLAHFI